MLPPPPVLVAKLHMDTPHGVRTSTLYYTSDVAPTDETQCGIMCTAIRTLFQDPLKNVMSAACEFGSVQGTWYGPGDTEIFGVGAGSTQGAFAAPTEGDDEDITPNAEDLLPDEAAIIIQKKTGKRGRKNMGRLFLSGIAEQMQWGGQITIVHRAKVTVIASKVPMDVPFTDGGDFTGTMNARHWNREDNTLMPITKAYGVVTVGTRRDRRRPLRITRL